MRTLFRRSLLRKLLPTFSTVSTIPPIPDLPTFSNLSAPQRQELDSDNADRFMPRSPENVFHNFNYRDEISEAVGFLVKLRDDRQETCFDLFRDYLNRIINKQTLVERIQAATRSYQPLKVVNAMETVFNFMSEAEIGFLSGDFTPQQLQFLSTELKTDKTLEQVLQALMESISQEFFKIPEKGIPHPEVENQKNLLSRQMVIENLSFEIVKRLQKTLAESMANIQVVLDAGFLREMSVTNFPNLLMALELEIARCNDLLKNNQKWLKKTDMHAPYIVKMKPETLAMIGIVTLSRLISIGMQDFIRGSREDTKDIRTERGVNFSVNAFLTQIANELTKEAIFEKWMRVINQKYQENSPKGKGGGDQFVPRLPKTPQEGGKPSSPTGSSSFRTFSSKPTIQEYKTLFNHHKLSKVASEVQSSTDEKLIMPLEIRIKIASILVLIMEKVLRIKGYEDEKIHAVFKIEKYSISETHRTLRAYVSAATMDNYARSLEKYDNESSFMDRAVPMIFPPAPWRFTSIGGYYLNPVTSIRVGHASVQYKINGLVDLTRVYNIINYVSSVPWRINPYILNIIEGLWEIGKQVPCIPPRYEETDQRISKFLIKESRSDLNSKKARLQLQKVYEVISLRGDFKLKLQVARSFSKVDKFYFPHNLDFRGRLYPIPPHLNHIGNDLCRGVLLFSQALPIGKNGIRNMKIHVANKMGKDKLSFDDRVGYVEDNWSTVEKWLQDPLKNQGWMELEDCYQALAAMKELQNAMKADSPEDYCSSQAIHADGSCNGLQHYAALGRDMEGGFEVNLVKRDTPGDVYTKVAKIVEKKMQADIKDPNSPYHKTATFLGGSVKRKIVKQTVMTTVYGVTYFGAKKQIRRQLKEFYNFQSETDLMTASVYVSKLTLGAVEDLFTRAHEIKEWLIDCAKLIGKTDQAVSWLTPLGLPIVQPYRNDPVGSRTIKTALNFMNVLSQEEENCPIDRMKQASAFPPNFIHALDSTHLMLTSERMKARGYDFAAVHDSYWCHIANYDEMQRFLREEFVHMQEMRPLQALHDSFCRRFPDIKFKPVPASGDLDIRQVLESPYFFS